MDYIVSRPSLTSDENEMNATPWFILWKQKRQPFERLQIGDHLFWYDSSRQRIVWDTRVEVLKEFSYHSLTEAADQIRNAVGQFDEQQAYFQTAPKQGVGIAWTVQVLGALDLPRPATVRMFPQQRWLSAESRVGRAWLSGTTPTLKAVPSRVAGLTVFESYTREQIFGAFGLPYTSRDQYLNLGLSPKLPDEGFCIFITLDKRDLDPAYAYEDELYQDSFKWVTRKDRRESHPDYVTIRSGVQVSLFARARSKERFTYLGELDYKAHREFTAPDNRPQQEYLFRLKSSVPDDVLEALTGGQSTQPASMARTRSRPAGQRGARMDEYRKAFAYALGRLERVLEPRHQHYQVRLQRFLAAKGIMATWEQDFIDVQFTIGDARYIGEIKVTGAMRPEEAFRTALGQLLDYAHLRFPSPPGMIMFLDCQLDPARVHLAAELGIAVVSEVEQHFRLESLAGRAVDEGLGALFGYAG
jgi:hypothetical protein